MPISIIRAIGYTGARQQLTWPSGWNGQITAHLFGAGGGGSGGDGGGVGAPGQGGGYSQTTFDVAVGDILEVAIGRYGAGGYTGNGPPGSGGASLAYTVFNTRTTPASPPLETKTFGGWSTFMNNNAVYAFGNPPNFSRSYNVYFPYDGTYSVFLAASDFGSITVDGVPILSNIQRESVTPAVGTVTLIQGFHTVAIFGSTSSGTPSDIGGLAAEITLSFSGGTGGQAGPGGSSASGSGGGGATVLFKNGSPLAIAAGGSGAGGAGNRSGANNAAPGPSGSSLSTAGQNGQDKGSDGGGGGGGGGGHRGGNGGAIDGGDNNAYGGGSPESSGSVALTAYGRASAGANQPYYVSGVGHGGIANGGPVSNGGNGYLVLEISADGTFTKDSGGTWRSVNDTWINVSNVWRKVNATYVNLNGTWQPLFGSQAPVMTSLSGGFGVYSRPWTINPD